MAEVGVSLGANSALRSSRARGSSRGWRVEQLDRSLGAHAEAWDLLNASLFGSHPLLSSAFIGGLLECFGDGGERLCVLQGERGPEGMCILVPGRLGIWRSFVPSQAQIGPTLLASPAAIGGLFAALPGVVHAIELLCHDPRFGCLHLDAPVPSEVSRHAVTIDIPLVGGFEAYWQRRSRKLRDNLRRYQRRAEGNGPAPEVRILTAPNDVDAAVLRYAELEGQGWKGAEGTALGSDPAQLRFYRDLMARSAAVACAYAVELWAGGRLAASRLMLCGGGMVVALKTTHDESLREWAPGRVLMRHMIEDAFRRWPGATLEFYTNASVDQLSWADGQRSIVHTTFFIDRLRAGFVELRRRLRRRSAIAPIGDDQDEASVDVVQVSGLDQPVPETAQTLLDRCEEQHFQLGSDWYTLFARAVAEAVGRPRLATVSRGAFGVAALALETDAGAARYGGTVGGLANYYSTLYAPALAAEAVGTDLLPVFDALAGEGARAAELHFSPLDPEARSTAVLSAALRAAGYAVYDYFAHGNWYLPVQGDWASYLAGRPGALRSTVARMSRKVAQAGGRIEVLTSPDDVPRGVEAYQHVYARSWKRPEPFPGFMPELIAWCARRGWLRLGLLWLQGRPVAAQLWVVAYGKAFIYKLAYDKAFAGYAPGTVLSAHLMRQAIEVEKVREVDYLVGDDPYKQDWMTHRRQRRGLVAYDLRSARGTALALRAAVAEPVLRWVPTFLQLDRRRQQAAGSPATASESGRAASR